MDETALLMAIAAAPGDSSIRLAYADWLEERGDERAEYIRLEEAARGLPAWTDSVWAARDRRRQLRASSDAAWLQAMGYADSYRPLFAASLPDKREHRWRLFRELVETWHKPGLAESQAPQSFSAVEARLGISLPAAMQEFYHVGGLWTQQVLGVVSASVDPPGVTFGTPLPLDERLIVEFRHPPDHEWLALCDPPVDDPPVVSLSADDDLSSNTFTEFVLATWVADTVFTWPHRKTGEFQFWPEEAMSPELGFRKCCLSTRHLGDVTLGEGPDILMAHSVGMGELTIVGRTPEAFAGLPVGLR